MILMLIVPTVVFADTEQTIEDYLDLIEQGEFTSDTLVEYEAQMENDSDADALYLFLEARVFLDNYQQVEAYENLLAANVLLQDGNQLLRAEVLYYLMEIEFYMFNINAATEYAIELRTLSESIDYPKGLIEADYTIGFSLMYNYDYDEGIQYASEAFDLSRKNDYQMGYAGYYSFLSDLDYYYADKESALEKLESAIENLPEERTGYVVEDPLLTFNKYIASINISYLDAELGLSQAEALFATLDTKDLYSNFYVNYIIGEYYLYIDDALSVDYYLTALDQLQSANIIEEDDPYLVYVYMGLGNAYYNVGDYQSSADYYYEYINYDYIDTEDATEAVLNDLDDIKYEEINSKVVLLDQLNEANLDRVNLSNKMIAGLVTGIVVLLIAVVIIVIEIRSKTKAEKELYKISITDSLTQTYNRKKIIDIFSNNIEEDTGLILLDIDDFKSINDTHGHIVGDEVLAKIADIIKGSIRDEDSLGRYGGEEFLVFLKDANDQVIKEISERVRANIANYVWNKDGLKTTASLGATKCFSDDPEIVLHEADVLMYQAKRSGKNRTVFSEQLV